MNAKPRNGAAYFQPSSIQAFLAVQGHLFTLEGFAMPGDHTHAHPDLLIIYANFSASINPQRTPSPVWWITTRIALRGSTELSTFTSKPAEERPPDWLTIWNHQSGQICKAIHLLKKNWKKKNYGQYCNNVCFPNEVRAIIFVCWVWSKTMYAFLFSFTSADWLLTPVISR